MELHINTHTQVCSTNKENAIGARPEPKIISLKTNEDILKILTTKLNLEQYKTIVNEIILASEIGGFPEGELIGISLF